MCWIFAMTLRKLPGAPMSAGCDEPNIAETVTVGAGSQVVQAVEEAASQGAAKPLYAQRRPGAAGHRGAAGSPMRERCDAHS